MNEIKSVFQDYGFTVSYNIPFSGAYILKNYGHPSMNQHAIQIEIDRSLYLDERIVEKSESFKGLQNKLTKVIKDIILVGK